MPLTFRQFRNKNTGKVCFTPAGRYGNFLNSVKRLVHYVRYNIPLYYFVHLTLTVAENVSEVDFNHLHRVTQFIQQRLKRAGSEFKYIAVKELQEWGAIHYHVLCVYSVGRIFSSSEEIAKSWGLGYVWISAPNVRMKLNSVAGYIGKYIGEGYEYEALDTKKSFTASQIRQIYKLSSERLAQVIREFGKEAADEFKCTCKKVYEIIKFPPFPDHKTLVMEFPSEWGYLGTCDEAF